MNQTSRTLSLCICTYNRADQLEQTLESILVNKGELIDGDEILVVDNNSTDNTQKVIHDHLALLPLKTIFEPQQGLASARNAGLNNFINSTIIFIDDDISISDGFFQTYRLALDKYKDVNFFGGKILVDWRNNKPSWLTSYDLPLINGLIGYYDQSDKDPNYHRDSLLPYGANFGLRRNLIESIGSFNINLGVKGNVIGRGEETEYLQRALDSDFKGRYVENAVVFHRFQTQRLTTRYLYQYGFQKGMSDARVSDQRHDGSTLKAVLFIVRGLYQLIKNRTDRYFQCVINVGIEMGKRSVQHHNSND